MPRSMSSWSSTGRGGFGAGTGDRPPSSATRTAKLRGTAQAPSLLVLRIRCCTWRVLVVLALGRTAREFTQGQRQAGVVDAPLQGRGLYRQVHAIGFEDVGQHGVALRYGLHLAIGQVDRAAGEFLCAFSAARTAAWAKSMSMHTGPGR